MARHTPSTVVRVPWRRRRAAWLLAVVAVLFAPIFTNSGSGQVVTPPDPPIEKVLLSGQIDLQKLIDLAVVRLGYDVQYDRAAVAGTEVTLRIGSGISDQDLWSLTNQLLASHGLTSVEMSAPGADRPVISIVKLADAASLARIETQTPLQTKAGFATVKLALKNRPAKEIVDFVKVLVSKTGGAVQELPGDGAILVSDVRPRIDLIIQLVLAMDSADGAVSVVQIDAHNIDATTLVGQVTAAAASSGLLSSVPLKGKLVATRDDRSMVLISPGGEVDRWRQIIASFDRPLAVETRTYAVKSFTLEEVTKLLENTAKDLGPGGSGERWRIVSDSLSGLLIVTATSSEHQQIEAIIARLNNLPEAARRPVRSFAVRNRSVSSLLNVLTSLLDAGVLDADITPPMGTTVSSGPSVANSADLQRSQRSLSSATTLPQSVSPPMTSRTSGAPAPAQRASLILTADEGTNTLIAVGEPRKLEQLEQLLRTLDVRQPQVMIEVLVVSLSDGDTLDLGVELEKIEVNGDTVTTIASLFGLGAAGGAVTGKGFTGLILNPGDFRILIRALQTLNDGRSLNMPKVLVGNNQQANLDAVVQQPFVSTNASDTVATTSFGGFENAGTTITVKPQIAKGDHLVLEYAVSLSAFVGESSDPGIPPPRQQNNLQSVVTVPDGYTVVVGGIEIETKADATSQVPFIGNIPIIGEAFKSRSKSTSRSRFYVFIRPSILRQENFEDLKYLSDVATRDAAVGDGFPDVEPRIIK